MVRLHVALLGAFAFAVGSGCAATAGSRWVSQPEPGPFVNDDPALAASEQYLGAVDETPTFHAASEGDPDGAQRARPRLDRTVTLGETSVATSERAEAPRAAGGAPVTVTINNYVTAPNPYAGYVAAPFIGDFRPLDDGRGRPQKPTRRPAPMQPGQNWPALPSYGPTFPFKTAPASPW
jgi:hypothetical protein